MLAQGADAERVVALGEATAFAIGDQGAMKPCRIREAKRAVEQNLARGGLEQVCSADNFGDAHGCVVGDAGQLITRNAVAAPDDEVAEVFAGDEALVAQVEIIEFDGFAVRDAKAPVGGRRFLICRRISLRVGPGKWWTAGAGPARSWIDGFVVERIGISAFVRSAERGGKVFAGAAAGIEESGLKELAPGGAVDF